MTCFHDHVLDALDLEYEDSSAPLSVSLVFCVLMWWQGFCRV